MNTCPQCQAHNRQGARFCQGCGSALQLAKVEPVVAAVKTTQLFTTEEKPPSLAAPRTRPLHVNELTTGAPAVTPAPLATAQRACEVKSDPLSSQPNAQLLPLPAGELLDNRRYTVLSIIDQSEKQNVYSIWDRWHRYCTKCSSTASQVNETFCQECGADFSDQPLEHPGYLLRETLDQEMFAQESIIASMGLRHEGLVNLHHAFEHRPYGPDPRFYLISDPDEGTTLLSLSIPQAEEKVLYWGKQLAEALSYLHSQGLRHRNLQLENVRLVDSQAKLSNFRLAEKSPQNEGSEGLAEEVQALGRMLQHLLGGQAVSSATAAIFERLSSPHRSPFYATAHALANALDKALEAFRRPVSMTHLVGRRSDVGKERELNEDKLLTLEFEQVQAQSKPIGLYVVADGMGGHSAGEVASALAAQSAGHTIASKVLLPMIKGAPQATLDYAALLKEASMNANRAVYEESRKRGSDMGSTLVAALVVGHHAYIANIGDSRAYLINRHTIQQLTTDHSLVQRLVATGQILPEEAHTHPQRNVIYRTVGDKANIEIDLIEHNIKRGDSLLLCSDGLHGMVADAQIQQKVINALHPQEACEELIRLANEAGGDDNITVIIVKLEEVP